jgi:predicted RNA-binding Zn-ribbon protein involved in translation (DUF1610 family)
MARIGTLDIETSPILAYVWSLWKQTIAINQIHTDWSILAFSYKWLDEQKVHHHNTGGRGADKVRDDADLMRLLWKFLDEADIVIAQNGVAFDVKKINARFLELGMAPPSPYKVIDTKLEAQRVARFTSNRLGWLSEALTDTPKSEHKEFPGFELWVECLADNPKAWRAMRRYNDTDIVATEKVYLKLRPYIIGHPNLGNYNDDAHFQCPNCGSADVQKRGIARTQVSTFHRYCCTSCGSWSRTRYNATGIAKRRALLTN